MTSLFQNSLFYDLLFQEQKTSQEPLIIMGGSAGSRFQSNDILLEKPIVVFDFETTGLDPKTSRMIEVGAIKYQNKKEIGRLTSLIHPQVLLSQEITKITGITDKMLKNAPPAKQIIPELHEFMIGCVGVAHNAEFDIGFLFYESLRLGIHIDYTIFCTLKMARQLLKIERRNLDALAKHFGLEFESRHRSIGDIQVTAGVFWKLLENNPHLKTIKDMAPYLEGMLNSRG